MAFTDFSSIAQVQEVFNIRYRETDYVEYENIEPSSTFLEEFAFNQHHIDLFSSEAARCENVIYPILRDVYKNYVDQFSLWSHRAISYDAELTGTPDYLISTKSALGKTVPGIPIIIVVEAKRNDFVKGWGQCLAELVVAQKINDDPQRPVYGIVTDGELWQFGQLVEDLFTRNTTVIAISELRKVFGAIAYLMKEGSKQTRPTRNYKKGKSEGDSL